MDKGGAKKKVPSAEEAGGASPSPEEIKAAADKKVVDEEAKKADRNKKDRERRADDAKAAADKKVADEKAAATRGHYVGQGKSLTSSKGNVAGAPVGSEVWKGDKVTPQHWGEGVFKRLVADGAVVEVK